MALFRKKDTVVQAYKVQDLVMTSITDWLDLPESVQTYYAGGRLLFHRGSVIIDSVREANSEDYIVEADGKLKVCRANCFHKHYQPIPTHEPKENS